MKVLCVDDEASIRNTLDSACREFRYDTCCENGAGALSLTSEDALSFDAAVVDQQLESDITGVSVGLSLRQKNPRIFLVMLTAYGTVPAAVEALRHGGFDDYLQKPLDKDALKKILLSAEKESGYRRTNETVLRLLVNKATTEKCSLFGEHPLFLNAVRDALTAADDPDIGVLLLGEPGTGKKEFARLIHEFSTRGEGPFFTVDCGAFAETLLESELFGHEKAAFTGANARRIGKFEACDTGTIFLDEIGNLSTGAQQRLLRVLQDKTFERLGSNTTLTVNVRVVAATNENLEDRVAAGTFRSDLFSRFNVFPVTLPPLRERASDIPILACRFLDEFSAKQKGKPRRLSEEAIGALCKHSWPANVRDLRNVIRAAALRAKTKDKIDVADLRLKTTAMTSMPAHPACNDWKSSEIIRVSEELDKLEGAYHECKNHGKEKPTYGDIGTRLGGRTKSPHTEVSNFFSEKSSRLGLKGPVRVEIIKSLFRQDANRWPGLRTMTPVARLIG